MALNKFMHPRNRYKNNRPDFAKLGDKYPDFKTFLSYNDKGKATLDFKDPEALRALTCTLLKEDFDLDLDVPLDHIIPTVPLRLNYIHWLEDLLEGIPGTDSVWGIDIGCGTSCIYPLLGAKMNGWNFWALEVDPLALQYAEDNVNRNQLDGQIKVIENTSESLFLGFISETTLSCPSKFHFTMCNPPFFGNVLEAQGLLSSRSCNRSEPSSVSTADEVEMIVEGGEVDFVKRMIQESKQVSNRVVWFTSMLGKKSSVGQIVAELRREKVPIWTTTEFCQGRTMRWGVAWSYLREAKKQLVHEVIEPNTKLLKPLCLLAYLSKHQVALSSSTSRFVGSSSSQTPTKKHGKVKPPLSIPVLSEYITRLFQKTQTDSTVNDTKQKTQGRGRQEKVQAVAKAMEQLMKSLEMTVIKQASTKWNPRYDLVANKNTWSHQRRKRRQAKMKRKQRDREEDNEMRGSQVKTDVKVCSSEVPDTAEMTNSRLKVDQNSSETITSQVETETFPPGCGVNCVKLPTDCSDNCQHCYQSEQVGEDMQREMNAQDTCYHGNCVNSKSMLEKGANGLELTECGEKFTHQKDVFKNAKRVKWKEDEVSEIFDFEPSKKRKKLVCGDGCPCAQAEEGKKAVVGDCGQELTFNPSSEQKESDTSHCKLSVEDASPAGLCQVQDDICHDQLKIKSLSDSTGVHLSSVQGAFCQNKEIHNPTEGALGSCRVSEHHMEGNEVKSFDSHNMQSETSSSSSTKGGENLSIRQEGFISRVTPRVSSSAHVHTSICMSSSDPGSSSDAEPSGPLLKCLMEVKLVTKGSVEVVFSCDPGQNRELLHQVAQYVKNHIARESKG